MASSSVSVEAGLEALKQHRYADAVNLLELFCHDGGPSSRAFLQAQMYLVKAYQRNGQPEQAIALCQRLCALEQPQISAWARQVLPTLSGAVDSGAVGSGPRTTKASAISAETLLQAGRDALRQKQFNLAVQALTQALEQLQAQTDNDPVDLPGQAQMWLVKAYQGNRQLDEAIALCQRLKTHSDPLVQQWAHQTLPVLQSIQQSLPDQPSPLPATGGGEPASDITAPKFTNAGRAAKMGVKLIMKGTAASLALASGITISLLFGMVLALSLSLLLIVNRNSPVIGLIAAVGITIVFNTLMFFLAPAIMDQVQRWLYGTRWITMSELERHSPEAAQVIRRVCAEHRLRQPKLGLIDDQNPTAFTYGSLPDTARLVVSRGLFTYLDDDEVATVYAHELGHIVHWDFAVMTLAATLVQLTYLMYVFSRKMGEQVDDKRVRGVVINTAIAAYIFHLIGTYLLLYLSRTREYFADHFAAETTGNPNGLSRALVKIAYGIVEEGQHSTTPNRLLEGTRALGIYDAKAATSTGTAYRIATDLAKLGRVFLWDLFNPWGWWLELQSTHPLTGKRVRALSTYAEQLGLEMEFDMGRIVGEGRRLDKHRLYGSFLLDLALYWSGTLGLGLGALLGWLHYTSTGNLFVGAGLTLTGGGLGLLLKTLVMYPGFRCAPHTDILTLMSDPYASPLRGQPVKLTGELIGRGQAGYAFGSDLKFQDSSGMIFLRYASALGPVGNLWFGLTKAKRLINQQGSAVGWFRRGIAPYVDLFQFAPEQEPVVRGYHRLWSFLAAIGGIVLGLAILLQQYG